MDGFTCSFCGSTMFAHLPVLASSCRECHVLLLTRNKLDESRLLVVRHVFLFSACWSHANCFPRAQCMNNASATDPATPLKSLAAGNKVVLHLCWEGDVTLSMSVS